VLTTQRKKLILSRLAADGQVVAKDLAQEFDTSEDTIRRDLRELARGGKLQRVHGGALPASVAMGDFKCANAFRRRRRWPSVALARR
jgi:DeoR/GlpR family transcriptional regulator of sugar metabolism